MHGLYIAETIVEQGVSGSIPLTDRPAGGAMLARLQRGDVLIAAKLDRLFRSALDALTIVADLKARGVHIHLLDLGGDISNGLSKLFFTIASAFAEAERDRIRERVQASKDDCRARGKFLGGTMQWGHRLAADGKTLEVDPAMAPWLEKIARLRRRGVALRKIAAAITRDGRKISHETVASVLRAQAAASNGSAHFGA
jgi:putative DNA-invertase from lambdoid prophage Rac